MRPSATELTVRRYMELSECGTIPKARGVSVVSERSLMYVRLGLAWACGDNIVRRDEPLSVKAGPKVISRSNRLTFTAATHYSKGNIKIGGRVFCREVIFWWRCPRRDPSRQLCDPQHCRATGDLQALGTVVQTHRYRALEQNDLSQ